MENLSTDTNCFYVNSVFVRKAQEEHVLQLLWKRYVEWKCLPNKLTTYSDVFPITLFKCIIGMIIFGFSKNLYYDYIRLRFATTNLILTPGS